MAITLAAFSQARNMPWLLVGWLWFLGVLVPVAGFVSFGDFFVADRYTYIASIGITWSLVAGIEGVAPRFLRGRWLTTTVIAIACAAATTADLPRWRDSLSLFNAALRIGPHYVSYNNRGVALLKAGQTEAALADYNSAIKLNDHFTRAYNNRGSVLSDLGRYDEAIGDLSKAIEYDPGFADAYDNRGNALARKGEPKNALADYDRCIKLQPNKPGCYNNRAAAYFQLKRLSEALADVNSCQSLGGQPHPGLVQALAQAVQQTTSAADPDHPAISTQP
jgi:tetratricopeptide (TPR) repeat protein